MEEVIYGDIYFIINFSMDFLVLYICGKLRHQRMKVFPLIFAASVGSFYALIALFVTNGNIFEWIILFCVAGLMCYIAFDTQSIKSLCMTLSLFLAVNFLLSGSITLLYRMINTSFLRNSGSLNQGIMAASGEMPPAWLFVLALGGMIFSFIWSFSVEKHASEREAAVHIELNGTVHECRGLCDSGNLLREPISGRSVLILTHELFTSLTGERFMKYAKQGLFDRLQEKEARQLRFIPMQSVGGSGILIGLIPDKVTVNGEERDVCIASDHSGSRDFAGYDLILSPSLLP